MVLKKLIILIWNFSRRMFGSANILTCLLCGWTAPTGWQWQQPCPTTWWPRPPLAPPCRVSFFKRGARGQTEHTRQGEVAFACADVAFNYCIIWTNQCSAMYDIFLPFVLLTSTCWLMVGDVGCCNFIPHPWQTTIWCVLLCCKTPAQTRICYVGLWTVLKLE